MFSCGASSHCGRRSHVLAEMSPERHHFGFVGWAMSKWYSIAAIAGLGVVAAVTFRLGYLGYDAVYSVAKAVYRSLPEITIAGSVLPSPSGEFGVGRTTILLPPTAPYPDTSRDLVVDLWYPIERRSGSAQRPGTSVVGLGLGQRARAGAEFGGALAAVEGPLPLIIYAPGWDGPRHDNTFLLANLASHGFIIAAIDDAGFSPNGIGKKRETALDTQSFDLSSEATVARTVAAANARLQVMVARVSATLDGLAALNRAGRLPVLSGSINHARIGMLGFSFGGAVAAESALGEHRMIAVANLDGNLFGRAATTVISKPYLVFNSDVPDLDFGPNSRIDAQKPYIRLVVADRAQQLKQALRPDAISLLFRDMDHSDFTDDLFSPSITQYLRRWSRTPAVRIKMREIQEAYLLAFFDMHLRGRHTAPLLAQIPPPFHGVELLAAATRSR